MTTAQLIHHIATNHTPRTNRRGTYSLRHDLTHATTHHAGTHR